MNETYVKKYILFDHYGVLVYTEFWYFRAGQRALADLGVTLDKEQYLRDMSQGLGTWTQARAAGVDEHTISKQREVRDAYYREYLRTEAIEIDGVVETLAELSKYVRIKFQAEDLDASPAKEVMERVGAIGLPTYVILRPKT